jgi:hypothetical protein
MNRLIRCGALVLAVAGPAWAQGTPDEELAQEKAAAESADRDQEGQVEGQERETEQEKGDLERQAREAERQARDAERQALRVARQAKLLSQDTEQQVRDAERNAKAQQRETERRVRDGERQGGRSEDHAKDDEQYERGTAAIDGEEWDEAIEAFQNVAAMNARRTDAALYWKAYAQSKGGRRADALATLQDLRKRFPQSRWLRQAQALEQEIRQASGQAPNPDNVGGDEDLKLMALNGLMNMESERAVPLLEKFLSTGSSPKLRERALFVLCQSGSPKAREAVVRIARGQQSPELQRKAIEYLGLFGGGESRQALSEIYTASPDLEVKKAILRSFMLSGEKGRLLAAAKGEASPELRREAIQQLGVMGAQDELWTLYQSEAAVPVKRALINALFIGGNAERLIELARNEKDPQLRRDAIQQLGLIGEKRTGAFLVSLYGSEKETDVKRQILQGLFVQGNAEALIEIARTEKDPALRKEAVGQLSHMGSPKATEFLLEILNK